MKNEITAVYKNIFSLIYFAWPEIKNIVLCTGHIATKAYIMNVFLLKKRPCLLNKK